MSLTIDDNLKEIVNYKDAAFPFEVWTGIYNDFPRGTMDGHWHNELEFGVLLSGELEYFFNENRFVLKRGDGIFINSGILHYSKQKDNCHDAVMFTLAFQPTLLSETIHSTIYQKYFQPVIDSPLQGFLITNTHSIGSEILTLLHSIYDLKDTADGYELQCIQMLSSVWQATCRYLKVIDKSPYYQTKNSNRRNEIRAKKIISYIYDHYDESLTIEAIAEHANISRSECFRCFKRFTDKKPVEFINDFRLTQASRLLLANDASISEVSGACGFNSSSYFSKLFKQRFGITPLAFRDSGTAN